MEQSLQKALKKAKRKQVLKITLISFLVVLLALPVFYRVGNHFAAKGSTSLHEKLFLLHEISQPNVQINSQVTSNRSMFGGNIVTNRSKNINGYIVPYSTLTSSYGWIRSDIDVNELIPSFHWSEKNTYQFDKQTKTKVASFYNPAIENYYHIANDLPALAQMDNYVAEVAISFDQPYTYQEIQQMIPDNLNIVWLYMTSQMVEEEYGPSGVTIYGFDPGDGSEQVYESFRQALKKYDARGYNETIQSFLTGNADWDTAPILGVLLTGQTQNFAVLEQQTFVRGASIGATAEIVPYITPEK
ncbi:MAG: sigma factor regulator N-terminal domain-containing protein [Solibacillus sp.]